MGRLKMWIFGGPSWVTFTSVARFLVVPRFARFVFRGQVRCLLLGLSCAQSSAIASRVAAIRRRGGKCRLAGDLAADDTKASKERYPVVFFFDVVRGFTPQVRQCVVGQK